MQSKNAPWIYVLLECLLFLTFYLLTEERKKWPMEESLHWWLDGKMVLLFISMLTRRENEMTKVLSKSWIDTDGVIDSEWIDRWKATVWGHMNELADGTD